MEIALDSFDNGSSLYQSCITTVLVIELISAFQSETAVPISPHKFVSYHVHIYTFSHLLSLYTPIDKGEDTHEVVFCV